MFLRWFVLLLLQKAFAQDAPSNLVAEAPESLEFLKKFGYLNQDGANGAVESLYSQKSVESALKEAQKFGGIPETGKLDEATMKLFKSKRCGVPDVVKNATDSRRQKRFILASQGWDKRHLSYFLSNWSPRLTRYEVMSEMKKAFDAWAKYSKLVFIETKNPSEADIKIGFYRGHHGDNNPFDGEGNILAHAFFPSDGLGGDIHFDDDENWAIDPGHFEEGIDFLSVAIHEMGHSLGLSHSPEQGSIMNPYYKGKTELGYDDILAMHKLYISRTLSDDGKPEVPKKPHYPKEPEKPHYPFPKHPENPEYPKEPEKPHYPYPKHPENPEYPKEPEKPHYPYPKHPERPEYPRHPEKPDWEEPEEPEFPEYYPRPPHYPHFHPYFPFHHHHHFHPIWSAQTATPSPKTTSTTPSEKYGDEPDTPKDEPEIETADGCSGGYDVVSYFRGEFFIIKNQKLWRLSEPGKVEDGYPVDVQSFLFKLPPNVKNVDAIYERQQDSSIIIFSGKQYWIFDGYDFIENSPRSITDFGLPRSAEKVDAAMLGTDSKVYVFKDDKVYTFNETTWAPEGRNPQPLSTFKGVPENLDAALTYKGETFFIKGDDFWVFDDKKGYAERKESASSYWLSC